MQKYPNKPRFLDQLVKNRNLTADGRDWLTLALDPFHDYEHQVAGFPDADGSQTIVSCYTYQLDVAKPAGVVGNWDAHVFSTPLMSSSTSNVARVNSNWTQITGSAINCSQGPLTIHTGASGAGIAPANPAVANAESSCLPALGVLDLSVGISRIIGMGYEVTNTTASMYKQGAVTSYRMPQYIDLSSSVPYVDAGTTFRANVPVRRYRHAPPSLAHINVLKGSRTWDAADGVYANCVLNSVNNPMLMEDNVACMATRYTGSGSQEDAPLTNIVAVTTNAPPALSSTFAVATQLAPFDTTGSYFTGLSPETTLTVKLRVYVERAPAYTESSLSVLATPSAGRDDFALYLYSHAISQLPVAVTVKENALGDWFKGVLGVLRDVSATSGQLLNPIFPGSAHFGNSLSHILGVAHDAFPSAKPRAPKLLEAVNRAVKKANQSADVKKIARAAGRIKKRNSAQAKP